MKQQSGLLVTLVGVATLSAVGVGALLSSRVDETPRLIDHFDIEVGGIVTVAGGTELPTGALGTDVALLGLCGVAADPVTGDVLFSDTARHVIGRVAAESGQVQRVAGTGSGGFNGDGRVGRETMLHVPCQLAVHPKTREIIFADTHNYRVRAVSPDGRAVRTIAGKGVVGHADSGLPTEAPLGPGLAFGNFSGDGGDAREAELNLPAGVALDRHGNVYIADAGNHRVRVVNLQAEAITVASVRVAVGAIETIAGDGSFGGGGDGGPALAAQLAYPKNLSVDAKGNVAFADSLNGRLRLIDGRTGVIRALATSIPQVNPLNMIGISGVAFGKSGELYYSDLNGHVVFELDVKSGAKNLVAGIGASGFSEDGTQAHSGPISAPAGLAVSASGELLFVEVANNRLRRVRDGEFSTIAGGASPGEDVPALDAVFSVLAPISMSPAGDLFIGDANLHTVRRVSARTGRIDTVAGTGSAGFPGLGIDTRRVPLVEPAFTFLGDSGTHAFLKDPAAGIIRALMETEDGYQLEHFAGSGSFGRGGDGGPATEAEFSVPLGMDQHPKTGEFYVSTVWMPTVRKIDHNGVITTVAGSGQEGYGGDGGPALEAKFHWPTTIVFDPEGNLFIADFFNNRIRVITTDGIVDSFAGTGEKGFSEDGTPAHLAKLNNPNDLVIDSKGNLYFTDTNNQRVRVIEKAEPRVVRTIAGTGERGFSGDGGMALEARLNVPRALALSPDEKTLYVTDSFNGRVRAVRLR